MKTDKIEKVDLSQGINFNIGKTDEEALAYVMEKHQQMKQARAKNEKLWDWIDKNLESKQSYKYNGQITPNMKIEEALIEASIGSQDSSIPITVESDGRTDGIMLNLARYTLDHFIYKEALVKEIRLHMDYSRARYGTAVLFSGLELKSKFVAKENNGYFNPKGELERIEELHVTIKDVPIRNAYFDSTATRFEDAVDCIYEEWLSEDEYKLRYLDDNGKSKEFFTNAENVGTVTANGRDTDSDNNGITGNMVKLWHYYNKLYAKYIIVANEEVVIYNGIASTRHGELPLIPVQYYCNPYSIYGIGIPERYAVIKGLNQNFFSAMIGGAWLNSGSALILGEGQEIDGDLYIEPGEVNLIEMTKGSARDVTPFNTNVNIEQLVQIIQLMDDMGTVLTGVNIKAPYTSPGKTAFETSVMKEEQNNRLKTSFETRVHGLEQAFSLMLSNIFTFLPYQYAEQMIDEQEKLDNYKWYQVPVKNKKLFKDDKGNITGIEEAKDYTDYFDLDPKLVVGARNMKVRITTPSTASTMKALEIENISKYIQAKQMVLQVKGMVAQMGEDTTEWDNINDRLNTLFNIDKNNIDIKSGEQELRDKQAEITQILNSLSITGQNATMQQDPMAQAQSFSMQSLGQGQSMGEQEEPGSLKSEVAKLGASVQAGEGATNGSQVI